MARKLKMAMIGCGGISRGHLQRLTAHPEVEVVALVDPAKAMLDRRVAEIPALAGAATFADYRRMLKAVEVDAVGLATPHTQHTTQILDCLDAGLHVLSEKPLTCSVADTKKVVAKARAKRKTVVVAFQRRWHAMRRYVRDFVCDKAFGAPLFVQSFLSQAWLTGTKGTWRQDPKLSGGGQINDSGSHIIDMIFWTLPARPTEVAAFIDNRGAKVDIDSAITYRLADGALGNMSILGAGPSGVFWEDMTVIGSKNRAVFIRNGVLTVAVDGVLSEVKQLPRDGNPTDHFVDVVRGRAKNESPPADFLPAIAFTEACWKSAATGGKVVKIKY